MLNVLDFIWNMHLHPFEEIAVGSCGTPGEFGRLLQGLQRFIDYLCLKEDEVVIRFILLELHRHQLALPWMTKCIRRQHLLRICMDLYYEFL